MKFFPFALLLFISISLSAQDLYDPNTIQEIKITFDFSNWDSRMDTAIAGTESYTIAKSVEINGVVFDSVGVKYKGNSSYRATNAKNPLHLELDNVLKNQAYNGFSDIKLSNGFADPTFVREVVSYWILSHYMECPKANFAKVYINGNYYGLMTNVESVSKSFIDDRFYSSNGAFFKCTPVGGAGGGSTQLPNLAWLGTDASLYNKAYEIKSDYGFSELVHLIDTLNNKSAYIDRILDVDQALWMLAFNNLLVNLDSYTGAFAQNYYLYQGENHHFNSVVWDLNMSFGGFPNLGSGGGPGGLDSTAMKNMSPVIQSTNTARPLIKKLLENPTYKRMYLAHLRTMLNEMIATGEYLDKALEQQVLVDAAVQSDANKFFTYANFLKNVYWGVSSGGGMGGPGGGAPGLVSLMNGRKNYLNGTTEISAVPPSISQVMPNAIPVLGGDVNISANISGTTTAVWLGWRGKKTDIFTRVSMLDDGLHGDGAANDGVYGASFTAATPKSQYYVYAENANAGAFFPARAEFEFLSIETELPVPSKGDIVINEILAENIGGTADQDGELEDWIELYNNTGAELNLTGLYLSDNGANKNKWNFPSGTTIPAHGYLVVWADEDGSQSGLHANFKFKASGESAFLSSATGFVLDSIDFTQQQADRSYGRFVNGTGNFTDMPPTFGAENSLSSATHNANAPILSLTCSPNPAVSRVELRLGESLKSATLKVFDTQGKCVYEQHFDELSTCTVDLSQWPVGSYRVMVKDGEGRRFEGGFVVLK